jgi:3-hydroxybutyryl-CoA dehydrogenase
VKQKIFARLDDACRPGTLLGTTTSSLSVAACAEATSRPGDVVGLHFFNPAPAMRLVEIGYGPRTTDTARQQAVALVTRLGKTPVVCRDRPGFIVNFLLFPYLNDAVRAVEAGRADPAGLDAAVREESGFPMGPLALLDTIGLDVSLAIQQRLHAYDRLSGCAPTVLLTDLVEQRRLGRKTGAGFHRY